MDLYIFIKIYKFFLGNLYVKNAGNLIKKILFTQYILHFYLDKFENVYDNNFVASL